MMNKRFTEKHYCLIETNYYKKRKKKMPTGDLLPHISKIQLPSGNSYLIKDAWAREMIEQLEGGSYFLGVTTTPLSDGANTNPIMIDDSAVTATNGDIAIYTTESEGTREFIFNGTRWFEFGDLSTLGQLAYKNRIVVEKGTAGYALGTEATFSASTTTGTINGVKNDSVLGSDTTFSMTQPTISVTPSTTYVKATASGAAVSTSSSVEVANGIANTGTATVLSGATPAYQYLETTSITPIDGTESVSSVSNTTSKLVTTSVPNVTSVGSASTWSFTLGSGAEAETLVIGGANSTTPTLGTAITAATGALNENGSGAPVVNSITINNKTVAKAGTAVTVATGFLTKDSQASHGDEIVTDVTESQLQVLSSIELSKTNVIPSNASFSVTQPTIALATDSTSGAGKVSVATGISSATATGGSVIANSDDKVTTVIEVGNVTVSAPTVGIKSNDAVKVIDYDSLEVTAE